MKDSDMMRIKRAETWNLIKALLSTLVLLSSAVYRLPGEDKKFFGRVQSFVDEMEAEFSEAL